MATVSAEEFQRYVERNWNYPDDLRHLFIATVGLGGETGEVLEHLKKHVRDGKALPTTEFVHELGDMLHYFTVIVQRFGLTLEEVMGENIVKLDARYKRDKRAPMPWPKGE